MSARSLKQAVVAGAAAITLVGASLGVVSAQHATDVPSQVAQIIDSSGLRQTPTPPNAGPGPNGPRGERGQRPQLTEEQRQQLEQRRQQREQQYVDALARNLGQDAAAVRQALEQTRKDMQAARISEIQQAVQEGRLTQEQADQMIQRIQNAPAGLGLGGPGSGPDGHGGPGFGPGGQGGPGGGPGGRGGPGGPRGAGR